MLAVMLEAAIRRIGLRLGREREHAACVILKPRRLRLPLATLHSFYPAIADVPITIRRMPVGPLATPLNDLVVLLKLVALAKPQQILELGSYLGVTAQAMAEHLDA